MAKKKRAQSNTIMFYHELDVSTGKKRKNGCLGAKLPDGRFFRDGESIETTNPDWFIPLATQIDMEEAKKVDNDFVFYMLSLSLKPM